MTKSPRKIVLQFLFLAVSSGLISIQICAQTETHSVQVASYLNTADAQAEVNRLRAKKLDAYWVKAEIPGMGTRYRVRIGKFTDENEAAQGAAQACKSRAFSQYLVAKGENIPTGVQAKSCKSTLIASELTKLTAPKAEPAVAKPAPAKPTTAKPAVTTPTVAKPAVVKPAVAKATGKPAGPKPAAAKPPRPAAAKPAVPKAKAPKKPAKPA